MPAASSATERPRPGRLLSRIPVCGQQQHCEQQVDLYTSKARRPGGHATSYCSLQHTQPGGCNTNHASTDRVHLHWPLIPQTRPHLFGLASSSKLENMDNSTERVPGEGGPLVGSGAERACPSRNAASSRSSLGRRLRVTLRSALGHHAHAIGFTPVCSNGILEVHRRRNSLRSSLMQYIKGKDACDRTCKATGRRTEALHLSTQVLANGSVPKSPGYARNTAQDCSTLTSGCGLSGAAAPSQTQTPSLASPAPAEPPSHTWHHRHSFNRRLAACWLQLLQFCQALNLMASGFQTRRPIFMSSKLLQTAAPCDRLKSGCAMMPAPVI